MPAATPCARHQAEARRGRRARRARPSRADSVAASSSACSQCVVARRPSSRPAAASANAPVQIDDDARSARVRGAQGGEHALLGHDGVRREPKPGTITLSATCAARRARPTQRRQSCSSSRSHRTCDRTGSHAIGRQLWVAEDLERDAARSSGTTASSARRDRRGGGNLSTYVDSATGGRLSSSATIDGMQTRDPHLRRLRRARRDRPLRGAQPAPPEARHARAGRERDGEPRARGRAARHAVRVARPARRPRWRLGRAGHGGRRLCRVPSRRHSGGDRRIATAAEAWSRACAPVPCCSPRPASSRAARPSRTMPRATTCADSASTSATTRAGWMRVTSSRRAGSRAGIDLALHLLERFCGAEAAHAAEQVLEHRRLDAAVA